MINYLTVSEWAVAVRMWRAGNDTCNIAKRLKCPEALIYNILPVYRTKWRTTELRFTA
jgi:hypothetical protein